MTEEKNYIFKQLEEKTIVWTEKRKKSKDVPSVLLKYLSKNKTSAHVT